MNDTFLQSCQLHTHSTYISLYTIPYNAIVHDGKLLQFSRISLQSQRFSSEFFFFIIWCFRLLYNRESFLANNKKTMIPRNVSTANDLHYTVYKVSYLQKLSVKVFDVFPVNVNKYT